MYFKSVIRKNPATGDISGYYRLVERYRNVEGRVCHRTLLNVGFMENVSVEQLNAIQMQLNNRYQKQSALFESDDSIVTHFAEKFWKQLIEGKKIDANWADKAAKQVDIDRYITTQECACNR